MMSPTGQINFFPLCPSFDTNLYFVRLSGPKSRKCIFSYDTPSIRHLLLHSIKSLGAGTRSAYLRPRLGSCPLWCPVCPLWAGPGPPVAAWGWEPSLSSLSPSPSRPLPWRPSTTSSVLSPLSSILHLSHSQSRIGHITASLEGMSHIPGDFHHDKSKMLQFLQTLPNTFFSEINVLLWLHIRNHACIEEMSFTFKNNILQLSMLCIRLFNFANFLTMNNFSVYHSLISRRGVCAHIMLT